MLNSAPAEPKITRLPHEPVKDPFSPDLAVQRELQRMEADRDKLMKQLQATQAALSKLSPQSRRVEKKFQKELCCNSQLRKLKAHFDKYGLMGDVGFNATNRTSGSANRTRAGPARPLSAEAIQYNATEQRLLTKMMGLEKKSESMKGVGDARSAVLLEMQLLLARILKVARSKAKAFAAAGRKGGRVQLQVNTLKKIKQKLTQLRQLVGKPGVDAVQIGRVEGQLHALIKHALSLQ
jgi:DNA repair exonuclease SbcCD ATPase subunit